MRATLVLQLSNQTIRHTLQHYDIFLLKSDPWSAPRVVPLWQGAGLAPAATQGLIDIVS
jgi:hypothetical protein